MGTDEMVVLALCFIEVCGNMNHSCTKIQKSTWINRPPILSNEGKDFAKTIIHYFIT